MNLPSLIRTALIVVSLGLCLLAAWRAYVLWRDARRGSLPKNRVWKRIVGCFVCVALMLVLAVGNFLLWYMEGIIGPFVTNSEPGNYVAQTTEEERRALLEEISDEGIVLLDNAGVLPIDTSEGPVRVNLLGYRAYDPVYSGSGSGKVSAADAVDFKASLEAAGFAVNPAPVDEGVYESVDAQSATVGFSESDFSITEPSLDAYVGSASMESMAQYSDIAIVVLGRDGGEGGDLTDFYVEDGRTYLEPSPEEQALVEEACDVFETVVIVYNGANAMELGFVEEAGADAVLSVGIPGPYGLASLGRILSGEVNPSGRSVDTWAYDLDSTPANEVIGSNEASNAEDTYYMDYVEGIYVGYRWYETAYAESAVITNTKTQETFDYADYESVVQYPFGHGLSYTTFEQRLLSVLPSGGALSPTGEVTFEVEVVNTGGIAGKNAVQIYLSAPYTDYDREHGVEKSAVELAGYGKSELLDPGESQVVEISVPMEDLASYDSTYANADGTQGSYRLDAGEYVFSLRSDSHTVIDSASLVLDADHVFTGEDKRASDEVVATNQLTDAQRGSYLSRNNAFENYELVMSSVPDKVEDTSFDEHPDEYDPSYDEGIPELVRGVDYDVDGTLTLEDLRGVDADDTRWDELVRQLSVEELRDAVAAGVYGTNALPSVGKPQTSESDGPLGISSMFNPTINSIAFPSLPVLASTFNDALAYRFGACAADMAHEKGVTGWYAPGMNIHRSQFSGRNYEYYSEDARLSTGIAASEVLGATDNGLLVYIKHFAFNDQENHRARLHTYLSEQAAREIYLKPFEASVKNGNANGVMTSMNYIGDVYVSYDRGLMTNILRSEWGFDGVALTDMTSGSYMTESVDGCVRAGTDMWLDMFRVEPSAETSADIHHLQTAAKHILYAYANSDVYAADMLPWKTFLVLIDVSALVLVARYVLSIILSWRQEKAHRRTAGD